MCPAPGGDLVGAVLPVRDAVADAPRVVPEQLGQHGDVAPDQRPLVPLERGSDLGDHLRPVENGTVLDPRLDLDRHAVEVRPSATAFSSETRCTGTPAPGSAAAMSAATGWSSRTPSPSAETRARRFAAQNTTRMMPANR